MIPMISLLGIVVLIAITYAILAAIDILVGVITRLGEKIMAKLDELQTAVTEVRGVAESVVTLVDGLADKIEENLDEPERLQGIVAELRQSKDALAAAVLVGQHALDEASGTPAPAEAPTEAPTEVPAETETPAEG